MINFVNNPVFTAIDEDGIPIAGGKLYTYETGTATPLATYTDSTKGTANTNPVILDSNGQANVWIDSDDGAYRFKLLDADDVELWTLDGVQAPGGEISAILTVKGDLVYASAANTPARLARGTAYQSLLMDSTGVQPEWGDSAVSVVTARGDLVTGSGAHAISRLAKGTARQVLQMDSSAVDPEWAASPQSVLDAIGAMLYSSAANTLAKLAIGAAGKKMYVNAAGTAPEWADGFALGSFTRDTAVGSGSQAITGVGFKPSFVIMLAVVSGTAEMSVGFGHASANYCMFNYHEVVADSFNLNVLYSIYLQEGVGVEYGGEITSMDADGFTIDWIKTGGKSGTVTVAYLAIR